MTENKEARLAARRERGGVMSDFIAIARKEVERRIRPSGFIGQMSPSNDQLAARAGYRLGFTDAAEWAFETIWGEAIRESAEEAAHDYMTRNIGPSVGTIADRLEIAFLAGAQ